MSATLERMWSGADVRLRMYPGRARPAATADVDMELDGAAGTTDSPANHQASEMRFDPLRDHRLDQELQINRVPNPAKAEPVPTGPEDGGRGGRGRGGRGRGRDPSVVVSSQCRTMLVVVFRQYYRVLL